jgi:glycosyltransferase involved in cell wall biosynthesis
MVRACAQNARLSRVTIAGFVARLAIYTDAVYGVAQERLTAHSADHAFLTFAAAVGDQFDECVFVGRARPDAAYLPLGSSASFVPLPDYDSLANIAAVLRAAPGTARGLWRAVGRADVVWAFGPHPFASLLIAIARLRRRPVVLGVRQESDAYFRARAQGKRKLALARAADRSFRRAARGRRVTAVGEILAAAYRAAGADVLPMTVTLVHEADVVATVPARKWDDVELLAVGRLEPEKDPYLLIEVLAELERRSPGRYRLVWLGTGTLDQDVRERARDRGLEHLVDLRGHVLPGEVLSTLRTANIFLLTSKTEGVPQALIEAMASGTPIVATGVGGVRAALGDGRAGVVVDSRKPAAIADAVARVSDDEPLRHDVTQHALELARDQTLEAEALRVAGFVSDAASSAGSSSARSVELS